MSKLQLPVSPDDHIRGPRSAGIELVEYGDFECPYCGDFYAELKTVHEAMGQDLRFAFRHFPLTNLHPHALSAAMFAEAAATIGKFWEMHDTLFENQAHIEGRKLAEYGCALGFTDRLVASAIRQEYADKITRDFKGGVRSGVNGTPTLFINGMRYDGPPKAAALIDVLRRI